MKGGRRVANHRPATNVPKLTMRAGEPDAEDAELRQAELAVHQKPDQQRVGRNRGERDPQHRLGPVDRAHEAADRDEPQRRRDAESEPEQIVLREMRRPLRLAEAEQDLLAAQRKRHDRQRDQKSRPQAGAQRAPHLPRAAGAIGLRGERRHRRHQPHADGEGDEIDRAGQRRGGQRLAAEAADEGEVGRHHRDLAELLRRHRRRQPQRLDQLGHEVAARRLVRGGFDLVDGHGADNSTAHGGTMVGSGRFRLGEYPIRASRNLFRRHRRDLIGRSDSSGNAMPIAEDTGSPLRGRHRRRSVASYRSLAGTRVIFAPSAFSRSSMRS